MSEPVQHSEKLHNPFFSSRVATGRDLYRELMDATIGAEERQSAEEGAVGVDDFVFVVDVTDSNKVVVVVLVLKKVVQDQRSR